MLKALSRLENLVGAGKQLRLFLFGDVSAVEERRAEQQRRQQMRRQGSQDEWRGFQTQFPTIARLLERSYADSDEGIVGKLQKVAEGKAVSLNKKRIGIVDLAVHIGAGYGLASFIILIVDWAA